MSSARVSINPRWRAAVALAFCVGLLALFFPREAAEKKALGPRDSNRTIPREDASPEQLTTARASGPLLTQRENHTRFLADRLAAAAAEGNFSVEILRDQLRDNSASPGERLLACQKLALSGTAEAMQVLFETIVEEPDPSTQAQLIKALDLLTNEEGIEAITSISIATDQTLLLQAVEDCLSRCATAETVAYLSELHQAHEDDSPVAGRIRSMLEGTHTSRAIPALAGLLQIETPTGLFRSVALALSKSTERAAGRELIKATRRHLSEEQKMALREIITSSIEAEHLEVIRDEVDETQDEFWKSAYAEVLDEKLH